MVFLRMQQWAVRQIKTSCGSLVDTLMIIPALDQEEVVVELCVDTIIGTGPEEKV